MSPITNAIKAAEQMNMSPMRVYYCGWMDRGVLLVQHNNKPEERSWISYKFSKHSEGLFDGDYDMDMATGMENFQLRVAGK